MGAISPGRWQLTQCSYRIGATSFEKVGVAAAGTTPIAREMNSEAPRVWHNSRAFIRVSSFLSHIVSYTIAEGAQFRNLCHAPGTVACIMSKPSIAICAIEEHAMTIVPASKGGNF